MAYLDTPQTQRANRSFMKRAMKIPLLDAGREQELARRWRDAQDATALHELTQAYMRLVIAMATRFRRYGLPLGDLVQEGNVGLMQAAARFDPDRGVRFSTYASWWIRAAIQDHILRNWSIVRTGTTAAQKTLFFRLRGLRALIDAGTQATMTEANRILISDKLGVPVKDVETMEARLSSRDRSLNAPMGEDEDGDGGEWQDVLACDRPLPEDEVMQAHDRRKQGEWIHRALQNLTERERTIIRERRLRDNGATLESLGNRLGISKERVRQIEVQALQKMKSDLIDQIGDPVAAGLTSA